MFNYSRPKTRLRGAFEIFELIFHASVREVRKSHGNAILGLLINISQTVMLVLVFYVMFDVLGLRGTALRGDFLLYVFSGVFLFMTHVKTVGKVAGAEGPTSAMMKHAPMNTIVSISAAALSALYIQVLSAGIVLFGYHAMITPITIFDPIGLLEMFMLAWGTGAAIGMVFMALKPWAPDLVPMLSQIYQRVNMIASGKMFVVNMMPGYLMRLFDWNPLFHIIDQSRGAMFLNYTPRHTSMTYPLIIMAICLVLALMAEFYTRKHASLSWGAAK
jgi:ABC-type polysaccharide/polyol phosphate export permease